MRLLAHVLHAQAGLLDALPKSLPLGAVFLALLFQLAQLGRMTNALVVEPRLHFVRLPPCLRLVAGAGCGAARLGVLVL